MKIDEEKAGGNAGFEHPPVGNAAGVWGALQHRPGVVDELQGGGDDQQAPGVEKKNHADEVDPGLGPGPKPLVENVDPDVAVLEQGVPGTDEKDKGEQMPFQFLGEHEAGLEGVAHHHVDKDHRHHQCGGPGHKSPDPGIQRIDTPA